MLRRTVIFGSVALLATYGCQENAPPEAKVQVPPVSENVSEPRTVSLNSGAQEEAAANPPAQENASQQEVAQQPKASPNETTAEPSNGDIVDDHPFEPPFGDRVDLFSPPQRDAVAVERHTESSGPEAVAVSLKGFANINGARAVLQIGEAIASMRVGQEKQGVRVVSIDPPRVTLQRGNSRWVISLAD